MTMTTHTCDELGCHRTFLSEQALSDHAAVVHFNEIRSLVEGACQDMCKDSCYVADMTAEYVVFECYMEGMGYKLMQCTYEIADDNTVTLGEAAEVIRITTYEPKPDGMSMPMDGSGDTQKMGGMGGMSMPMSED